jgi:hypothetical protein
MSQITREELQEVVETAVGAALDGRRRIDPETHNEHHEFVQMLIRRQRQREALWAHVRKHVIGWAVVAVITGVGSLGWQIFRLAARGLERGGG